MRSVFGLGIMKLVLVLLCCCVAVGVSKPLFDDSVEDHSTYKDTEEILNEWNNDDTYYDYSHETRDPSENKQRPPVLFEVPSTTVTPLRTSTNRPVYFPKTNIELTPLFEQVGKARRKESEEPVDLPIPYIVWTKDPSGREDKMNYWKKFYNTMYKVD